jgi:hypothetical protein
MANSKVETQSVKKGKARKENKTSKRCKQLVSSEEEK